jgi:hypothetical protein
MEGSRLKSPWVRRLIVEMKPHASTGKSDTSCLRSKI